MCVYLKERCGDLLKNSGEEVPEYLEAGLDYFMKVSKASTLGDMCEAVLGAGDAALALQSYLSGDIPSYKRVWKDVVGSGCASTDRVIPWMENWLYEFRDRGCHCDECREKGVDGIIWHKQPKSKRQKKNIISSNSSCSNQGPACTTDDLKDLSKEDNSDLQKTGNSGDNGRSDANVSNITEERTDDNRSADGVNRGTSSQQPTAKSQDLRLRSFYNMPVR